MSRVIEHSMFFKAPAHEVYEALMDSTRHKAFTKSEAKTSREVGGGYTAYDGYIAGTNLELVPDWKIVQTWRASDWPEGHFSVISFQLTPVEGGTRLDFNQSNLPDGTEEEFIQGWTENYWEPMKAYLEGRDQFPG
ncbi:MAG TPA: SRPBCC family protein [Anaerolineales bacterium]|jgi:activator of HSP90 ATPase